MRACEGGCVVASAETATTGRFLACAVALIEAGCDVAHQDLSGHTALHVAFRHRQADMASFLLETQMERTELQLEGLAGGDAKDLKRALQTLSVQDWACRCQTCALNLKMWLRRRTKQATEDAAEASAAISRAQGSKEDEAARIMEEEFGGMDFAAELEKMKVEMGGGLGGAGGGGGGGGFGWGGGGGGLLGLAGAGGGGGGASSGDAGGDDDDWLVEGAGLGGKPGGAGKSGKKKGGKKKKKKGKGKR